ncbi:sigma-70 family RNA polymerase sigma factor [Candidatus Peregrinibacteria bacterium]|nr:MAG: sigma-70 family RNA polymerase sigma factor [Candidatus Peregrinibacteria bacterium]
MSKENQKQIEAWVLKAQSGDTQAFGALYDFFVKPVYRYLYYRVEQSTAEDLTEETFLKVWQYLPKYKFGKAPFGAWIFKIAHNLMVDFYRKNQVLDELTEDFSDQYDPQHPIHITNLKIDQIRVQKAIQTLPPNYQEVIVLKYINELENDEISEIIGKSEGSIRIIQFRALKKLKLLLEGIGHSE